MVLWLEVVTRYTTASSASQLMKGKKEREEKKSLFSYPLVRAGPSRAQRTARVALVGSSSRVVEVLQESLNTTRGPKIRRDTPSRTQDLYHGVKGENK